MESQGTYGVERSSGLDSLTTLLADMDVDRDALRMCVMLILTDLFAADPSLRSRFLESLALAREKAETEKSDGKVLTVDVAMSLLRQIP